jgi:hypothetical protein
VRGPFFLFSTGWANNPAFFISWDWDSDWAGKTLRHAFCHDLAELRFFCPALLRRALPSASLGKVAPKPNSVFPAQSESQSQEIKKT